MDLPVIVASELEMESIPDEWEYDGDTGRVIYQDLFCDEQQRPSSSEGHIGAEQSLVSTDDGAYTTITQLGKGIRTKSTFELVEIDASSCCVSDSLRSETNASSGVGVVDKHVANLESSFPNGAVMLDYADEVRETNTCNLPLDKEGIIIQTVQDPCACDRSTAVSSLTNNNDSLMPPRIYCAATDGVCMVFDPFRHAMQPPLFLAPEVKEASGLNRFIVSSARNLSSIFRSQPNLHHHLQAPSTLPVTCPPEQLVINTTYSQLTPSICTASDGMNNFSNSKSVENVASVGQGSSTQTQSISQLFNNSVRERYASAAMRSYRRHYHSSLVLNSSNLEENNSWKRRMIIMLLLAVACLLAVVISVTVVSIGGEDEPRSNLTEKPEHEFDRGDGSLPNACCIEGMEDLDEILEQNDPYEMQTSVFEQVIMPVVSNETIDSTPVDGNFSTDDTVGWKQSELEVYQNDDELFVAHSDTALDTSTGESPLTEESDEALSTDETTGESQPIPTPVAVHVESPHISSINEAHQPISSPSQFDGSTPSQVPQHMSSDTQDVFEDVYSIPWTETPTDFPVGAPTFEPATIFSAVQPSSHPTQRPIEVGPPSSPYQHSSSYPTTKPSHNPSNRPSTRHPSNKPTNLPTARPQTKKPSADPSHRPTALSAIRVPGTFTDAPTDFPMLRPSSLQPTTSPTESKMPSLKPTTLKTYNPTDFPITAGPTLSPSSSPLKLPEDDPTFSPPNIVVASQPSTSPAARPTNGPTDVPSPMPTSQPSPYPVAPPTNSPIHIPTTTPTSEPSPYPVMSPTGSPSRYPTPEPITPAPSPMPIFPTRSESTQEPTTDLPEDTPRPSTCEERPFYLSDSECTNVSTGDVLYDSLAKCCAVHFGSFDECPFFDVCGIYKPPERQVTLAPTESYSKQINAQPSEREPFKA